MPTRTRFALGFRVKSGYAIAIALSGPAAAPTPVLRRRVELSDPENGATKQPFHDGFGTAQEDGRVIARLTAIIERCTRRSIAALLEDDRLRDASCEAAGLVVGSVIDPASVGNPHIRAHASEGRLFRSVLEGALRGHDIAGVVLVEKQLLAESSARVRRSALQISKSLAVFGQALGRPWRGDEKSAALAAWIALQHGHRS